MTVDPLDPAYPFVQQANRMEERRKAARAKEQWFSIPRPWFGVFVGVMFAALALWAWINPAMTNIMVFTYILASLVNLYHAWKAFRAKAAQR